MKSEDTLAFEISHMKGFRMDCTTVFNQIFRIMKENGYEEEDWIIASSIFKRAIELAVEQNLLPFKSLIF